MKQCNKCQQTKSFSSFFKDKANKTDGHYSICKQCKTEATMKWRSENPNKYNTQQRKYNKKNYPKMRLQRYGITPEHHQQMLTDQNHVCAICKCPPKGKRPLAVDHRHTDGKVRGLLCYGCNRALHVLESISLLDAAKEYLEKYK